MKNWLKKVPREKLEKYLFIGMLSVLFIVFFVSLQFVGNEDDPKNPDDPIVNPDDSDKPDNPDDKIDPGKEEFIAPTKNAKYKIVRGYFDEKLEDEELQKAVMNYEKGRYISSIGISIANDDDTPFDCVATLSGEVTSVNEDSLYGIVVTITHENGVTSEYSSLSEVSVKAGDKVKQGDKIGISGTSVVDSAAGNHVYFIVRYNKEPLNPTTLFGKKLSELIIKK